MFDCNPSNKELKPYLTSKINPNEFQDLFIRQIGKLGLKNTADATLYCNIARKVFTQFCLDHNIPTTSFSVISFKKNTLKIATISSALSHKFLLHSKTLIKSINSHPSFSKHSPSKLTFIKFTHLDKLAFDKQLPSFQF